MLIDFDNEVDYFWIICSLSDRVAFAILANICFSAGAQFLIIFSK